MLYFIQFPIPSRRFFRISGNVRNRNLGNFYFFFLINFFLLNFFYSKHKNLIKSNNKKNNYMNQLLRLPLLKYTHTHTHTRIYIYIYTYVKEKKNNNKKKDSTTLLPQEKKGLLQHPRRRSPRQQSRNRSRQLLPQRSPPQMS